MTATSTRLEPHENGRGLARPIPWRLGDVYLVYATVLAGGTLVVLGWYGSAGTANLGGQLAWMSAAIGGTILAGTGASFWFVSGYRAVQSRRSGLAQHPVALLAAEARARQGSAGEGQVAEETAAQQSALVSAPQLTRYHRPDCALVAGRTTTAASRATHERAGRTPCGVCAP
jgi:hypothetical protein